MPFKLKYLILSLVLPLHFVQAEANKGLSRLVSAEFIKTYDTVNAVDLYQKWQGLRPQSFNFPELSFINSLNSGHQALQEQATVWIKLTLSQSELEQIVSLKTRQPQKFEVYHFRDGKLLHQSSSGFLARKQSLNLFTANAAFYLRSKQNGEMAEIKYDEILISFQSRHLASVTFKIQPHYEALQDFELSRLLYYFYLGACFILVVYQLSIYLSLKESFSLFYTLYVFSAVFTLTAALGLMDYFLPKETHFIAQSLNWLGVGLMQIFAIKTIIGFQQHNRILVKILLALRLIGILNLIMGLLLVLNFMSFNSLYLVRDSLFVLFGFGFLVGLGYSFLQKQHRSALLLLAWSPPLFYSILKLLGLIPTSAAAYSESLIVIPLCIEMLLMALLTYFKMQEFNKSAIEGHFKAEQNETLKHILRAISHDLANYFFLAKGYVDNLKKISNQQEVLDRNKVIEFSQKARKAIENAEGVVVELRNWIKSDESRFQFQLEKLNLPEVIQMAIASFEAHAQEKNVSIKFSRAQEMKNPVMVLANQNVLLNQVLGNILSNAIKFTPRGQNIHIHLEKNKMGQTRLSIQDSGQGIPEDKVAKFFETGYIGSTPGTEKEKGTGFGLLLVKNSMEAMEGQVRIYNAKEGERVVGAVFELLFPAADQESGKNQAVPDSEKKAA